MNDNIYEALTHVHFIVSIPYNLPLEAKFGYNEQSATGKATIYVPLMLGTFLSDR